MTGRDECSEGGTPYTPARSRLKDLNADGTGDPQPSPCTEAPELRVSRERLSLI